MINDKELELYGPLPRSARYRRTAYSPDYLTALTKITSEFQPQHLVFSTDNYCPRPLTLQETMAAIVEDYNRSHDGAGKLRDKNQRELFLRSELSTCTGIAHRQNVAEVIVMDSCPLLIEKDTLASFIPIDFLHMRRDSYKWTNQTLTKKEVLNRGLYHRLVNDDIAILSEYCDIARAVHGEENCLFIDFDHFTHDALTDVFLYHNDRGFALSTGLLNRATYFLERIA